MVLARVIAAWQVLGEHTLAFLLEGQFTLLVVVLVLSTTAILASLCIASSESFSRRLWRVAALTFPLFLGMLESETWCFSVVGCSSSCIRCLTRLELCRRQCSIMNELGWDLGGLEGYLLLCAAGRTQSNGKPYQRCFGLAHGCEPTARCLRRPNHFTLRDKYCKCNIIIVVLF